MELCTIRDECQFGVSCKHSVHYSIRVMSFIIALYRKKGVRKCFLKWARVCKRFPFSKWANGANDSKTKRVEDRAEKRDRKMHCQCQVVNENCIACRSRYCIQRVPFAHLLLSFELHVYARAQFMLYQHCAIQFYISCAIKIYNLARRRDNGPKKMSKW